MRKILITGAGSYIGTSVERWLNLPEFAGMYQVDSMDMRGNGWRKKDFAGYDTVFHVAGIAHADVGRVSVERKKEYYRVNCDLAAETAEKAKREDVRQFIFMSSMIVYGEGTSLRRRRVITWDTEPSPANFYGDSKWKAERRLRRLGDDNFHVAILRPPMIYGEGCKGNYQMLKKIALHSPVFPDFPNVRSVLSIENLCEYVRNLSDRGAEGIYFPQDPEYVSTSELVREIANRQNRRIWITPRLNWCVRAASMLPGKIGRMTNKAFGSLVYEQGENQANGI